MVLPPVRLFPGVSVRSWRRPARILRIRAFRDGPSGGTEASPEASAATARLWRWRDPLRALRSGMHSPVAHGHRYAAAAAPRPERPLHRAEEFHKRTRNA